MLRAGHPQPNRVGTCERIIATSLFIVGLVSYQQLAAPFCAGLPHTLPSGSQALSGYPCNGNRLQRTAYVLGQTPYVLHDVLRLSLPDLWVTVAVLALLVRMVAAFTLPAQLYSQVVAPVTMYVERAIMPCFHLLLGPNHRPSTMALRCMFNTYAIFDLTFFCSLLGVWDVNIAAEVVYCVWAAGTHVFLCRWHSHAAPSPVSVVWQLLSRVLVLLTTLHLSMGQPAMLGRSRRGPGRRGPSAAPAAAGGGSAAHRDAPGSLQVEADGGKGGGSAKAAGLEQEGTSATASEWDCGPGSTRVGAAGLRGAPLAPEVLQAAPTPSEAGGKAGASVETTHGSPAEEEPGRPAARRSSSGGAVFAATAASSGTAATAAAVDAVCELRGVVPPPTYLAPGQGRLAALRPYRSPIKRTALRMKIPWAEPEQLAPGFEARLAHLAAAQGLQLAGAFVRPGCIELVLLLLEAPNSAPPLCVGQRTEGTPKGGCGAATGSCATGLGGGVRVDAWLGALGLEPPGAAAGGQLPQPRPSNWQEVSGGCAVSATLQPLPGGMVDEAADAGTAISSSSDPLVLSVLPRVLPLRCPRDTRLSKGYQVGTGSRDAAASGPPPTGVAAVLCVRVSWPSASCCRCRCCGCCPTDGAPPAVEVLVRSANTYLPARISGGRWATKAGEAGGAAGGADDDRSSSEQVCGSGGRLESLYDMELLALPPVPGTVLLEFRCAQEAAAARGAAPLPGSPLGASPGGEAPDRRGGAAVWADCVPLLATHDPDMAAELNTLAEAEAEAAEVEVEAEVDTSQPGGGDRQLDELMYDLGTWIAACAAPAAAPTASPAAAPAAGELGTGAPPLPADSCLDASGRSEAAEEAADSGGSAALVAVLGPHLLQHLQCCGLSATAASVRAGMQRMQRMQGRGQGPPPGIEVSHPAGPQAAANEAGDGSGAKGAGRVGVCPELAAKRSLTAAAAPVAEAGGPDPNPDEDEDEGAGAGPGGYAEAKGSCDCRARRPADWGGRAGVGGRGSGGGIRRAAVLSAVRQVLGLEAVSGSGAAAYEAYKVAWSVAQGHTVQVVECLVLLSLLVRTLRAGLAAPSAEVLVSCVGCGVGTFTTAAWLVLPYRSWVRLARAVQVPRYTGHLAAKALVALGGLPAPPGISAYVRGPAALLLEGLILPGACLMSPLSASLVCALKLPLNAALMHATGAVASPRAALLLAARVEALALTTTLSCHVYMRLMAHQHQHQHQAAPPAAPPAHEAAAVTPTAVVGPAAAASSGSVSAASAAAAAAAAAAGCGAAAGAPLSPPPRPACKCG